ncbi:hypothetical protein CC78DRAFT_543669 [Lojkania enalia]|uniref:TeaA receptor TeaR n=1 Tax=Lojkania enalia TaxID=147567 RepID=A0A9P4KA59_9PLEO|nr:hypothetical protein CC78DRAFT_543669 [Didymosphaeria enalia]
MAVASPRQPPTAVPQLTPPNSSHGGRRSWDFAVPLDNIKTSFVDQKPFMSEDVSTQPRSPRNPLTSQPNGTYKQPPTNGPEARRQYYNDEQGHLVPNRVDELQSKGSDVSGNGSDPDSVLEYYKDGEAKNGTRNASQTRTKKDKKRKGPASNWVDVEKDDSNWIHRDKLAQIESRELEEAGFTIGRASRSNSRSHSATRSGRGRKDSETSDNMPSGDERQDRRMVSPIPAEEDDDDDDDAEPHNWDLRTLEEITAERDEKDSWSPRNHIIRPSTSRIPVAKTSPVPVPNTFVERDAPLPRSRKGSANWTGDAIATNGARVRSGSASSQVLLDEPKTSGELLRTPIRSDFSNQTSPITGSPPKTKTPAKAAPTSGARKTSAQRSGSQAKRNTSATSPIKRPGTSGGSISRPTTSHRPEGEAPWIATMYKPDPRLPPDQQIIPTHAKRMQQEQWESEGKTGSAYDREFKLLNTEEFDDKRNSNIQPLELEKRRDDEEWPLPSPTKSVPDRIDTNVKSPTNEQGGYKLTPTIPQSPRIPSRSSTHRPAIASPKPTNTIRVPEPQLEKQKKNCCCIVM